MAEHRYEREIDELLRRLEKDQPAPIPFRRRSSPWAQWWSRIRAGLGGYSAVERLMCAAVLLLLATLALGIFSVRLAAPMAGLALACFVLALALSVWQGASGRGAPHARHEFGYPQQRSVDWNGLVWRVRRWMRRFRG